MPGTLTYGYKASFYIDNEIIDCIDYYLIATKDITNLSLLIMPNEAKRVVNNLAGNYVKYTDSSTTIEKQVSLNTAQAVIINLFKDKEFKLESNGITIKAVVETAKIDQQQAIESWSPTQAQPIKINIKAKRLEPFKEMEDPNPAYHLAVIPKGVLGEISKIEEELKELKDSIEQQCRIMSLVEVSDLIGSIQAYLEKHFKGFSIQDLLTMSRITQRAFDSGKRKSD